MCCFSQPVEWVANTSILARATPRGTQILVYSMSLSAREDLAMVLPIPVPPGGREDAVRFIDLEGYPKLFEDIARAFPAAIAVSGGFGEASRAAAPPPPPLVVHDVGAFEASFVPTTRDFGRLDPRFVLPQQIWDKLEVYRDYGFAVFKLRGFSQDERPPAPKRGFFGRLFGGRESEVQAPTAPGHGTTRTIHPMAFEFPRRDPSSLFFPTVHVHDGDVHPMAAFDHTLYFQPAPLRDPSLPEWRRSDRTAAGFVDDNRARDTVDPAACFYRLELQGPKPNRDIWVSPE